LHQGEAVKKISVHIAWVILLLGMANVQAGEYVNGGYLGGKLGVNNSSATGNVNAPNKSTLAYVMQGGYLQAGYIFDSRTLVTGVGAYFDWNPSVKYFNNNHVNEVTYGSRAYGVDAKVGLPLGSWMPYAKLGYGYSAGTKDLKGVAENGINATLGIEYKLSPHWSALGEFKIDSFGSKSRGISIKNKTTTFGFNYYFSVPPVAAIVAPVEVEEVEVAPAPVVAPVPVTDAPPI
jgi:outer membrane immunogenic protein